MLLYTARIVLLATTYELRYTPTESKSKVLAVSQGWLTHQSRLKLVGSRVTPGLPAYAQTFALAKS